MTLVELLVVLVVLGILSSLTLSGLLVARNSAKIAKTSSTIRKLHEVIVPYYEEYEHRRVMLDTNQVTQLLQLPQGRTNVADLRRIALRRLMTMELPERMEDLPGRLELKSPPERYFSKSYSGVRAELKEIPPVARRYLSIIGSRTDVSSQEFLHLIVTRGPVADPDIIAHFRPDEVADTDGNGLPEFIDGWGEPIAFRRWPTGFASPAQPIDGTLTGVDAWLCEGGHRLIPLIFSSGPDLVYDMEVFKGLTYFDRQYDPFSMAPGANVKAPSNGRSPIRGEVVLVPVRRPAAGGSGTVGPTTFFAIRKQLDGDGEVLNVPSPGPGCTPEPGDKFFTVASERDVDSPSKRGTPNGRVESRDNIHNHDLAR